MSVSDLTNTTWLLNSTLIEYDDYYYYDAEFFINFNSNGNSYNIFEFYKNTDDYNFNNLIYSSNVYVYDFLNNTWTNQAYRTIEITGGTDATNSTLISWLEANATQQESGGDTSTSNGKIGDLSIIKKHFGDLEVIKEVLNGATIYEAVKTYTITSTITNGSYTGDSTITNTASVTISANTGYSLPSTISVSGATYTYDSTTGVVSLSSPTSNVTIEATCVASYPSKSDIVTMNLDGTNRQYRVLKNVSGSVFEVLGMFDPSSSIRYTSSTTSNSYSGSNLDNTLNNTYYNTLTQTAKSAIIDKTFTVYKYEQSNNTIGTRSSSGSQTITRYIYTLDVDLIKEYTNGSLDSNTLYNMIWGENNTLSASSSIFTATANRNNARCVYTIQGTTNKSTNTYFTDSNAYATNYRFYRPVFQIDLSKISYTKN